MVQPSISRSDDYFLGDGVEFMWGDHSIDIAELNDLFDKVCPPSYIQPHRIAIRNAHPMHNAHQCTSNHVG